MPLVTYLNYWKREEIISNQTSDFESQSLRYVSSFLNLEEAEHPLLGYADFQITTLPIESILDVGCGNGNSLKSLCNSLSCKGVGIEPSPEAVSLLSTKFIDSGNLEFRCASVHHLPFASDSFDLVTAWSVLHWVGRNEYLQSIGEMIRVTRKYLVIMDFVAKNDYRVTYHHDDDMFTFKMDFEKAVLQSGIAKKLHEDRWWISPEDGKRHMISKDQLSPFLQNPINYHSRKMVIFEKVYDKLPILNELDFGQ